MPDPSLPELQNACRTLNGGVELTLERQRHGPGR